MREFSESRVLDGVIFLADLDSRCGEERMRGDKGTKEERVKGRKEGRKEGRKLVAWRGKMGDCGGL